MNQNLKPSLWKRLATHGAAVALLTLVAARGLGAAPTVDGRFYGGGDDARYTLYNTSIGGSKLWYTFADNKLYVALVVDRGVNDNVFGNRDYTRDAGWSPPHTARRLVDSEYAQFTLTIGTTSYQWNQGYGELVGGVWQSDHTTGAGSGTPPPGYVSTSSFAWNINNYVANPSPNWNLYANGANIADWKSPFDPAAPNTVIGLEGYPATGPITWSDHYQWEWPMVYEWSADLSSFGPEPVFVISSQSHHSPAKSGNENDFFPPPPGDGYLTDYGDLPAPYPTLRADNGARHYLVPNGALLGARVDPEPDGQPHPLARGDDLSGQDDEDGVTLLTPLIPGQNARIEVVIGFPGYLSAFVDWNNDGTLDPVTLLSATGPATVAAGILGDLHFSAVGPYELTVEVPASAQGPMASRWRITNQPGQGGNSQTGLATTGEVEDHIFTASIGDRVWIDLDKDGIQDPGEPGFPGVTVSLHDADDLLVATTVTDADGLYQFDDLLAGDYSVRVSAPAGYVFSPANVGGDPELDSDADAAGVMPLTTLRPGQTDPSRDAGLYAVGSIGDTIYYDWDGDGSQGPLEAGIPGVVVALYDADDMLIASTTTDASGFYLFDNLPPGTYTVKVGAGIPAGYLLTGDPDAVLDGEHTVALALDQIYLDADFGYQPAGVASIGDTVFEDKDGDGVFNNADVGIDGVTLILYHDVDGDGVLGPDDPQIATTVTAGGGQYLFASLDPQLSYLVQVVDGPASGVDGHFVTDYVLTTPADLLSVTPSTFAAQSNAVTTVDFGYLAPEPASISGHVFEDVNNDGLLDAGDLRLENVTVTLYRLDSFGNREMVASTPTDSDGYYLFPDLMPGNYVVVVSTGDPAIPAGYATSLPEQVVLLTSGEDREDVDFPFVPLLIKTVDKAVALPGDTLVYTLRANPPAAGPVRNLTVVDPLPANTDFVAASHDGVFANGEVRWDLGSTAPGTQGTLTEKPLLLAFQGGGEQDFWAYDQNTSSWSSRDDFGDPVAGGGALVFTGIDIFGMAGGGDQAFRRFNVYTTPEDTWVDRSPVGAPGGIGEGGSLVRAGTAIYALAGGNSTAFRLYDVATDSWTDAAPTPSTVGRGGRLTSDGTAVYALRGNNSADFWRYDPGTDDWAVLASAPASVGLSGADPTLGGTAMAYNNGSVYVLRGDGTSQFWRYDVTADAWSTTTPSGAPLTQAPLPVSQGGAMVLRSVRLYTLFGNGSSFGRYNIAENNWTLLPDAPGTVSAGGAIVTVGGVPTRETEMFATPYVVRTGDTVTVQVNLSACGNCPNDTNLQPPALTVTATGGASATYLDGPLPAPQDIPTETTRAYYYRYSVTAGAVNGPQSLTFAIPDAFVTGDLPSTYPPAAANSVIVVPDLTLTVAIDEAFTVGTVFNTAQLFGETPIGGPVCYVLTDSTTCGDGIARLLRLDAGGTADLGPVGTTSASTLEWSPDGSRLHTLDGNTFGWLDLNTGAFTELGPVVATSGTPAETALSGSVGDITAVELQVAGLAFDSTGTLLYAVHRRDGAPDLLFQIDPLTGRHVEDAFGAGRDYRVLLATDGRQDVADLAFHPDGTLFAIAANTGTAGDGDLLVVVPDPGASADSVQPTGVANSLSPDGLLWVDADQTGSFTPGDALYDVQGLSIAPSGRVEIVTGSAGPAAFENSLFQLDLGSALATWIVAPSGGCNPLAVACRDAPIFSALDTAETDTGLVSLSGVVWEDTNTEPGDTLGILDPGEPLWPGITVNLYDAESNLLDSTTTDEFGAYRFDRLLPGSYVIAVEAPAGYAFSPRDVGSDPSVNSDIGPTTPYSDLVVLDVGEEREHLNAGLYFNPTLAVISSFRAFERDGVVVVEWTVQEQFDTLGYELQRRVGDGWERIGLVAADQSQSGPYVYELPDSALAPPSGTHTWRILEFEGGGRVNTYGPYTVAIDGAAADYAAWAAEIDWQGADDSPDADPDGDGLTNWQEFLAGTDPLDPNSVLRISGIGPAPESSGIEVRWTSVPGRTYVVAYASTLDQPFLPLPGPVTATDTESRFVLPGVEAGFFRVVLSSEPPQ